MSAYCREKNRGYGPPAYGLVFLLGGVLGLGSLVCLRLLRLLLALVLLRRLFCLLRGFGACKRLAAGVGILGQAGDEVSGCDGRDGEVKPVLDDVGSCGAERLGNQFGLGVQACAACAVVNFKVGHAVNFEGAAGGDLFPRLDLNLHSVGFRLRLEFGDPPINDGADIFLLVHLRFGGLFSGLYVLSVLGVLGHFGLLLLDNSFGGLGSVLGVLCGSAHGVSFLPCVYD